MDLTWTPEPAEGAAGACLTRDPVENFTEFGSGSFEVGNNGYVFGRAAPQVDDLVYKREGQPDVHAELSGPAFVAVFPEWDYEELDELEVRSGGQAIERCEYTNGDLAMCRAV